MTMIQARNIRNYADPIKDAETRTDSLCFVSSFARRLSSRWHVFEQLPASKDIDLLIRLCRQWSFRRRIHHFGGKGVQRYIGCDRVHQSELQGKLTHHMGKIYGQRYGYYGGSLHEVAHYCNGFRLPL